MFLRDAAGRNARLFNGAYYRPAVLRGVLLGQLLLALVATLGAILLATATRPLFEEFEQAASAALWIYLSYTAVVLLALGQAWSLRAAEAGL